MNDNFKDKGAKRQLESPGMKRSESWSKRSKNEEGGGGGLVPEQMLTTVLLRNTKAKGAAIGKRGNTITHIRARADVGFSISKEDSVEHIGWIKGKPWAIASALIMLSEELANAFDEELKSIILLVDYEHLGSLLGPEGSTVKEIQERTGCKIFASPKTIGNSSQKLVEVIGEKFDDAIAAVIEALSEEPELISMPYTAGEGGEKAVADAWGDLNRDVEKRGPRINRPRNKIPTGERSFGRDPGPDRYGGERPRNGGGYFPQMDRPQAPWAGNRGFNREEPGHLRQGISSQFKRGGSLRIREGPQERNPQGGRWAKGPEGMSGPEPSDHQGSGFREERTIFVPTDMISEVVGKRGVNIKHIRERTGAKIMIEKGKEEDFSELKLIVSGGHENIAHAASMIHDFSRN